jgi:predicted permease
MSDVVQDFRYAARQLYKSPWFAITAIVTLALGIGANTAVFSALNALLLKMLPVHDPTGIYTVLLMNGGTQPPNTSGTGNGNTSFSYPVYRALRQETRVFSDLIAHVPLSFGKVPVRNGDTPTEKAGEEVSGNYFSGLGVPMALGHGFTELNERNHDAVVVLSYGFWTEAFARDPSAIGRTLFVKGIPFSILGVTAPTFFGVQPGTAVDFWIPLQNRPELNAWGAPAENGTLYRSPNWWALPMIARLAPGVTPEQAQQAVQATFWQAASEGVGTLNPKTWPAYLGFDPIRGISGYARSYRAPVEIMLALVGLVLLIACTNVAMLILARSAARERELAMRIALGARATRLFRQMLVESLMLVSMGASLGWLLALGATRALSVWAEINTGLAPDRKVLLFTLAVASLTALVFGLAPLFQTLRISLEGALRSSSQTMSQSRSRVRSGNVAISLQIAMCFTLLVASGLTMKSLLNYQHQDLGMRAESLLVFDVNPQSLSSDVNVLAFYDRLIDRVRSLPGVEAASLVQFRPGSGWRNAGGVTIDGLDLRSDSGPHVSVYRNSVGADFFPTMGISVLQGRGITNADTSKSAPMVVVNESFAQRFLKSGALGHRIGDSPGAEIVGVVKNSKYAGVTEPEIPTLYFPLSQVGIRGQISVEVRTSGNPMALLPEIRRAASVLDPNMPLQKPMTQAAQFEETYITPRLFARLAFIFGLLATLLVATGLYGTLAYRVQRRRSEIGVRMALGALRIHVMAMILKESLWMFSVGVAVGIPLSFAVSRLLSSQVYHLRYLDPASFLGATAVTLLVALGSALLPARKASQVEPMEALRTE